MQIIHGPSTMLISISIRTQKMKEGNYYCKYKDLIHTGMQPVNYTEYYRYTVLILPNIMLNILQALFIKKRQLTDCQQPHVR
jgi:hypothetical protein